MINIVLIFVSSVIILIPVSFIIRSSLIYNKDQAHKKPVIRDENYLKVQIRFQWYTVSINMAIAITICIMSFLALSTLKYFFASSMKS